MKRLATASEMLLQQKLAQDYSWAEDFEPGALGGQENDRDRVAEVWKRVENSIYQGPDSALPEVIKILESIPEVIALAATREREGHQSKTAAPQEYDEAWVEPLRTAERVLSNMDLRESGRGAVDERLLTVGEAARALRKVIQMVEGQV